MPLNTYVTPEIDPRVLQSWYQSAMSGDPMSPEQTMSLGTGFIKPRTRTAPVYTVEPQAPPKSLENAVGSAFVPRPSLGFDPLVKRPDGMSEEEFGDTRRAAARSMVPSRFPESELLRQAVKDRQATEGNVPHFYNDAGGIAIGQGLNLTVQNEDSLRRMVGADPELFNLFKPYLGKRYNDLSEEDIERLTLSKQKVKALNSLLGQHSLASVEQYRGQMSNKGVRALADLQHYAGDKGIRASSTSKLRVKAGDRSYNPVAEVIAKGSAATDEDMRMALQELEAGATNSTTRSRVKRLRERLGW